jgi:hypothetical protein
MFTPYRSTNDGAFSGPGVIRLPRRRVFPAHAKIAALAVHRAVDLDAVKMNQCVNPVACFAAKRQDPASVRPLTVGKP